MLLVFLAIILQGMLREGVSAWMPTFISDSFHLGNEISILTGVLLPVFSILCLRFANWLYRKIITHPILCAGALFGIVAFAAFMLYLFCQSNIVVSILSIATVFGSISGVNLMLIGMIPPFFAKRGAVSTISGILNFFTYVGSAVSTYGIAALSEGIGWSNTFLIWIFVALAGGMICLLCIKPWNRTFGNDDE
jgi:OPA family glycerol-3-phosphate transporter-like MFS transporter